jgi:predicted DNA-binding protein (MmcQ/YjbR family)
VAAKKKITKKKTAKKKTAKKASKDPLRDVEQVLRAQGMSWPEVTEEFPWGHRTLKVKGKAFIFMGIDDGRFHMSVKLPQSGPGALMLKFCQPTGYGLGKAGWVSADFGKDDMIPVDLLRDWLKESYQAVAPKKLAAQVA